MGGLRRSDAPLQRHGSDLLEPLPGKPEDLQNRVSWRPALARCISVRVATHAGPNPLERTTHDSGTFEGNTRAPRSHREPGFTLIGALKRTRSAELFVLRFHC
jgi:hypothetical protein